MTKFKGLYSATVPPREVQLADHVVIDVWYLNCTSPFALTMKACSRPADFTMVGGVSKYLVAPPRLIQLRQRPFNCCVCMSSPDGPIANTFRLPLSARATTGSIR